VNVGGVNVESQAISGGVDGEAQPGDAGPLPRRADIQHSPRR
jgi:hypothetical protein